MGYKEDLQSVMQQIPSLRLDAMLDEIRDNAYQDACILMTGELDKCKSPIEKIFFANFVLCHHHQRGLLTERTPDHGHYFIEIQPEMNGLHPDFLVVYHDYADGFAKVLIECDGHDFHEKTKEQTARDKGRDRSFLMSGYPVMRFTGSELFKDPCGCIQEVTSYAAMNARPL